MAQLLESNMSKSKGMVIDYTAQMYERCTPIVKEVALMISEMDHKQIVNCSDPDKKSAATTEVIKKLITSLIKQDALTTDVDQIFSILYTVLDVIKSGVSDTLDENTANVSKVIYNVPELHLMKVKDANIVYQRLNKLKEIWKPIMEDKSLDIEI